jgi:hypothetical protein
MKDHNIRNACTTAIYMGSALDTHHRIGEILDMWGGGHLELMMELSEYAIMSERFLMYMKPDDYPGVYDYEVSTPFGKWFAEYILQHEGNVPSRVDAETKLIHLIKEFFDERRFDKQCKGVAGRNQDTGQADLPMG